MQYSIMDNMSKTVIELNIKKGNQVLYEKHRYEVIWAVCYWVNLKPLDYDDGNVITLVNGVKKYAGVAQMVEQETENLRVDGSKSSSGTNIPR